MSTDHTNPNQSQEINQNEQASQPVVGLPGDERDVLISRVIDGVATSEDWKLFRAAAAHDASVWAELAETQQLNEMLSTAVDRQLAHVDEVHVSGGVVDDQPLRARLDIVSRWGGWAAAAAILFFWFFGNPVQITQSNNSSVTAGLIDTGMLLDQAQPDQAFNQYLDAGQRNGQVIGEMPEHIVIETRPMADGTIEVLYLRQVIERQIIDHAYREIFDESGNAVPVPIELSPNLDTRF